MKRSGAKKIDMLNGPIWSKLPLFALPVAATAILEQLFNASDLAVVGILRATRALRQSLRSAQTVPL